MSTGSSRLQTKVVDARGARVHYLECGHGPRTVVLLHGWGSNPWVYERFMRGLPEDRFRTIAVDWFGDSERPWQGWSVSAFADEVRDVMDALGVERAALCGHSLGGITSQLFALRYLERLEGLILVGTGPTTQNHGTLLSLFERLRACGGDPAVLSQLVIGSYGTRPAPEEWEWYVERLLKAPYEGLVEAMGSGLQYEFVPLLPCISVPCLVVHGVHETGRTEFHVNAFETGLPDCRVERLDCGHYPMEELADEFTAAVRRFLERLPDSSRPGSSGGRA